MATDIRELRAERDRLRRELDAYDGLRQRAEQLEQRNETLEAERRQLRDQVADLIRRVDAAIADGE
ncbi:MAG TPA: hypothetical protein VJ985_05520 [Gammaproteobacteria bacterium]|nr:hypothetical protein [Gammaproteobacteria bacterium]